MKQFSLHELACFDAVVTEGGFHAAADKLHRSHPSIFTAVKNLEENLGLSLFDRSNYRVVLTEEGKAFHARARSLLMNAGMLKAFADYLAGGEESDFRVAVGSLCPSALAATLLKEFSSTVNVSNTRFHLYSEAVSGTLERLLDNEVDLTFGPVERRDPRFDSINLFKIDLIPVVAPNFLKFPITKDISVEDMRPYVQCVLRDSARKESSQNYFLIDGASSWTVASQSMKKELIVHGLTWGHMPRHLIEDELTAGRLLSIEGSNFKSLSIDIAAARLRDRPHGPIANRLWQFLNSKFAIAEKLVP